MSAALRKTLADLRRRKLQSAIVALVVGLSTFAGTLSLSLLVETNGPFDRAFQTANGAQLTVWFDPSHVSSDQVRSTAQLAAVSEASGPYRQFPAGINIGPGDQVLTVQGRASADSGVDRVSLSAGRWVQKAGEVVISSRLAGHDVALGSVVTPDQDAGLPPLTVVGIGTTVADSVDAWVVPAQLPAVLPAPSNGKPANPGSLVMYYRLRHGATDADITAAANAIAAAVPNGEVQNTISYLQIRRNAAITEAVMIPFLLSLSVFALVAAMLIIANVVTGAVLAGWRDLGVMKAIGFTPLQLVSVLVVQVVVPAMAASLVGLIAGVVVSQPLIADAAQAFGLPVTFTIAGQADALWVLGVVVIVVLSAAFPAIRAGRMPTATVIAGSAGTAMDASAWANRLLARLPLARPITLGGALTWSRPLRALMTVIAVGLGVAAVTFAGGLQQSLSMVAASLLRTSEVQVQVQRQESDDASVSAAIARQPQTRKFVGEREGDVTLAGLGQPVALFGYHGDSSWLGYALIHGRWFLGSGEAVAPTALMDAANLHLGERINVRANGNSRSVEIVGVILDQTNDNMLLRTDWSTLSSLYPGAEPDQYEIQLKTGADAGAYAQALMAAVQANAIYAQPNQNGGSGSPFLLIDAVLGALTLVLAAIAAAGIFNTVLLTTREKAVDIAILKAVGMTPAQTIVVVLASVVTLGLAGAAVGIPAGIELHHAILNNMAQIASRTELPASFYAVFGPAALAALGFAGCALAIVSAWLPAQIAARGPINAALKAE